MGPELAKLASFRFDEVKIGLGHDSKAETQIRPTSPHSIRVIRLTRELRSSTRLVSQGRTMALKTSRMIREIAVES